MIEFISMNNASNNLTDITFHMFAELSSKPDIQKLCSFSREGNAFFTKSKSPVAEYISKTMELRSGGWLHRKKKSDSRIAPQMHPYIYLKRRKLVLLR